jgi:hypothetical protein
MYVKVFSQILDSSLAKDYSTRHIFMDLLVLADLDGVVDMTHEAIARRTNVPIDIISGAIAELESPDPDSRSDLEDGRRLVRLDDHRDWGWQIVNYDVYREMRDDAARRAYFRDYQRKRRATQKLLKTSVTNSDASHLLNNVTQVEAFSEEQSLLSSSNGSSKPLRTAVKRSRSPMVDEQTVEEFANNPTYSDLDVYLEAGKFKTWCETNRKNQSRRRFVNWLNNVR